MTNSLIEVWKDIQDYEQYYMISNFGRIKSKDRITKNKNGKYLKKGKILKIFDNGLGYKFVYLKNKNTSKKFYIHRLVAREFVPNSKELPYVNHIDCNPSNNVYSNLEWCTPQENTQYMFKMNRQNRSEQWYKKQNELHELQKKPVVQMNNNYKIIKIYNSINETKLYGFNPGGVCECCNNKRKTHHGFIWRYL